jgi:hypothetical protein
MKLKANQIADLEKIAAAEKPGLPEKQVHFRVRAVLTSAGLIKATDKKGVVTLTITAEGRKALKAAAKALAPA